MAKFALANESTHARELASRRGRCGSANQSAAEGRLIVISAFSGGLIVTIYVLS
jgi:hypothetical protein